MDASAKLPELRVTASGPGRIFILKKASDGKFQFNFGVLGGGSLGLIDPEKAADRLIYYFSYDNYMPKIRQLGWSDFEQLVEQKYRARITQEQAIMDKRQQEEYEAEKAKMIADFGKFDGWELPQFQQEAIRRCYPDADDAFFKSEQLSWRSLRDQTYALMSYAERVKKLQIKLSQKSQDADGQET